MRRLLRHFLWFAALCAGIGLLVAWLGLVSIAASVEHWPPAKWFLHFTMREAVQTQARGIDVPPLDDLALLRRGAGLYAFGCASCHGAPGQRPALAAERMIPPAPPLDTVADKWRPRELFWIVRNGIKYTAMPAWTAPSREDEVWAAVAFLLQQQAMSAQRYRALAHGEGAPLREGLTGPLADRTTVAGLGACTACHGRDGGGRDGTAPRLAGQHEAYLVRALREYAAGHRASGIMQPIAAALSDGELRDAARAFSAMPPVRTPAVIDRAAVARGERIAREGMPQARIAPCGACHGLDGAAPHARHPVLHGQPADDLVLQLRLFLDGRRDGTPDAVLMRTAIGSLSEAQARDVSLYYQSATRSPAR